MPYIDRDRRAELDCLFPATIGDLNYKLTSILLKYLRIHGESYQQYNELIGVLECAKLELYRKSVAKYEDKKCQLNGEVYP